MIRKERRVRVRRQLGRAGGSGGTVVSVRELYLRDDVPCRSLACPVSCPDLAPPAAVLPVDGTHYVIPDFSVGKDFLELLELPFLRSQAILFFQTVASFVQFEGGRRQYNRLKSLLADKSRACALFLNEFHASTYLERKTGETLIDYQRRILYHGVAWYRKHLQNAMPLVILSEDAAFADEFGLKTVGIFVMSVENYFLDFWPDEKEALDLCASLSNAVEESKKSDGNDNAFRGHLPEQVLNAGIKSGRYIQGILQVNKYNSGVEAYVRRVGVSGKTKETESDILIIGKDRNRAIHQDSVVVEMLPEAQWKSKSQAITDPDEESSSSETQDVSGSGKKQPTGRVVGIFARSGRDFVCTFSPEDEGAGVKKAGKVLVIPYDYRIPKIRITTSQKEKLKKDRIVVRVDGWDVDSFYPSGHFVRSLGAVGNLETEMVTIMIENELPIDGGFSEGIVKEQPVPSPQYVMDKEEIARRKDLRQSHLIFSIDPVGCEDVDDALSVLELPNGNLQLGVHIADVSHFVKPNSLTDLEARNRSTTVYMADRRYDMLPTVLSADLCSLLSGVDRYAVSVLWELDSRTLEVVDVWFGRTVIKSKYKLYYELAQEIVDGAEDNHIKENIPELSELSVDDWWSQGPVIQDVRKTLRHLVKIAKTIQNRRVAGGALELEGIEIRIELSSDKSEGQTKIEDLIPKAPLPIHETVAECMIFANHWVAKKIHSAFPQFALLRHHPLPRQENFQSLISVASARGFSIRTDSAKTLASSLNSASDSSDPQVNKILRNLATHAMSVAAYFSTGSVSQDSFFHYGLALGFYTHFTSPIRRYADVIVHRLLLAAVGDGGGGAVSRIKYAKTTLPNNKDLQATATHINQKHRASQNAQKSSVELFQVKFFSSLPSSDSRRFADAVVFGIRSNGLLLFIARYGIKSAAYLVDKESRVAFVDTKSGVAEWTSGSVNTTSTSATVQSSSSSSSQVYRVFDHVTVSLTVRDAFAHAPQLVISLVSNRPFTSCDAEGSQHSSAKSEMIDHVTTEAAEMEAFQSTTRSMQEAFSAPDDQFRELKRLYGNTDPDKSFYHLVRHFKNLPLYSTPAPC